MHRSKAGESWRRKSEPDDLHRTNILLYAQNADCPEHEPAWDYLLGIAQSQDVAICELVLVELYLLLRTRPRFGSRWDRPRRPRCVAATGAIPAGA